MVENDTWFNKQVGLHLELMRCSHHESKARNEVTQGRKDALLDFTLAPGHRFVGRSTRLSEHT